MSSSLARAMAFVAGMTLLAPPLHAQTPPKIVFNAEPHPPMDVRLSGYGTATYFPDRLEIHVRVLLLSNVAHGADVVIESIGLEVFTNDGRQLGKAQRVPVRKALAQRAELRLEKLDFTVPMAIPSEDFRFYLAAYRPDDAFWITTNIDLPSAERAQKFQ